MNNIISKAVSMTMAFSLAISGINVSAITVKADKKNENKVISEEGYEQPEVVEEIVRERTKDSTTFLLSTGMKQTTYYSDDIYFENEKGELKEFNPELRKISSEEKKNLVESVEVKKNEVDKYKFTNDSGDSKQFIPTKVNESTPIVMTKDDYAISFAPTNGEISSNNEENIDVSNEDITALSGKTDKVQLEEEKIENIYNEKAEEKNIVANYSDKEKNIDLSYESLNCGVKETIILHEKPDSNVFTFKMTLQGMIAKKDEIGNGITIYSEDGEDILGGIDAPFMNDVTNNNYSENLTYELEELLDENNKEVHKYMLKLNVDTKYLDEAKYPISIDPTVSWSGTTTLPEAYVLNNTSSTNYFSSGVKTFSVGKGAQGVFRTYFRALDLAKTVDNKYIDSATLTIYENGSSVSGAKILVKPAKDSFKCGSLTWNNQPGGTSATLASFKSSGKVDAVHEINLKTWVQNVAKGSGNGNKNYGLEFKADDESGSSYVKFYGARASKNIPKLKVVYYDAPSTASSVSATCANDTSRTQLKSGENLNVSWKGISAHALSYIQYRIENSAGNDVVKYSENTHIGTTASGNKNINVSSLSDGTYKVYVRGVDKGGIKGTGKGASFVIDKTNPVINTATIDSSSASNYSSDLPEVKWKVTDKNFKSVQFSLNEGVYKWLSDDADNSGKDDEGKKIDGLISGKVNSIKIRAIDKAGNTSVEKSFTYYYDKTDPTITASITPNTNKDKMDNYTNKPKLKYSITDSTLKSYEVLLNNNKINVNSNSGEIELEGVEEGENTITLTAVDKADNETDKEITYYRDTVKPEKGEVRVTPKTGFFNSSNKLPTVKWSGINDDNLSEVQIKVDDGAFKTLGFESSGEGLLPSSDFPEDGKYNLTIRGIDKAGNTSEEIEYSYYYETKDYELEDYTPTDVYAIEQLGGNTIIRFSTKSSKYRDDVKYQVYRSETPNVVINESTFVKSFESKGTIKISNDEGKTYYYKLRTVKKTGDSAQYSDYSEEISSTTKSLDMLENRLGDNSLNEYMSFNTPNGTAKIELSRGNFIFTQQDISLPAPQLPVNMDRTYNSKSTEISSMGYGWRQAYDMYVSKVGDKIYYVDGTNAVYTFNKKENEYICNENEGLTLEIDDDRLNRKIEKEETVLKELELDVYYKIKTKDGNVYRFDDGGRLVLMEESNGTFVYVDYNSKNGRIESVSTSKGQEVKYSYNEEGLISKITAAPDNDKPYSYEYQYDNSRLKKATFVGTNGDKIEYKYRYNNDNRLSAVIDAMDNEYSIEYNEEYISKFHYPNGEYTTFSFTKNQKQSQPVTKIKGYSQGNEVRSEEYNFTIDGRITYKKDSLGNTSSYSYDKNTISLLTDTTDKESYYTLENDTVVQKQISNNDKTEYDSHGNIIKSIDADGTITKNTYDYSSNSIDAVKKQPTNTNVTDPNGNITENTTFKYDKLGNVIEEIDYIKNIKTIYTYGDDGEVSSSQEYIGQDVAKENFDNTAILSSDENTEYNENGDEVNEESSEGTVEKKNAYIYDDYGNVIVDISSNEEISEDLVKNLKKDNSIDNIKALVKGTNLVVNKYYYDEFLRTIKTSEISKKGEKTTENKYNENGSVIESVDEKNRITKTTYDSMNRTTKTELVVDGDSKITNTSYSYGSINRNNGRSLEILENLNIVTVTNDRGEVVGKTYTDAYGRTVREMSNGIFSDYTYDNNGKVFTTYVSGVNESNPDLVEEGKLSVSTYDKNGNLVATIINPEIKGDSIKVGDNSIVTRNEYDSAGNLLKSIDAMGNETSYEYDSQGRISKVLESEEVKGTYNYDEFNKIDGKCNSIKESITYVNGAKSVTATNGSGQVLSISDESADGNLKTSYEYDKEGLKVKETYNDGSYVKFEYDIDGNQTKKMSYTPKNELDGVTEYVYNDENQLVESVDKHGETPYRYTFYEYDKYGRNISVAEVNAESKPSDEIKKNAKLKYVYNVDDNIEKIYYPNNSNDELKGIKFNYNKDKWIVSIDALFSGDESAKIREYVYHNDGKVKTIKDYKNFLDKKEEYIYREYTYDVFDRVTSMKYSNSNDLDNILETYNYSYDKNSNITRKREVFNYINNKKDEDIIYTYNSSNQLIKSENVDNLSLKTTTSVYDYDKMGNRSYDAKTVRYTVADEGEILEGTYHRNEYNKLNQLVKVNEVCTKTVGNNLSCKTYVSTYKYDDKGNKEEEVNGKSGDTTAYAYDVENQLVDVRVNEKLVQHNEYNGAGQRIKKVEKISSESGDKTETTNYFYEGSLLLYTTNENGEKTSQNIIGNASNTFATIRYEDGQKEYFYSKDVQGSITNITDTSGNCANSYDYTDFGETSERLDSTVDNEICYTGGVYDKSTGLYYLNARYYNPEDGVFMSQDTYRGKETDAGSWNLYGYCEGNPINYVDPSGHFVIGAYAELQAGCGMGLFTHVGVFTDTENIVITFSLGGQYQVNASASASLGLVVYPTMKKAKDVLGVGWSTSLAWSYGIKASVGATLDWSNFKAGVQGELGYSAAIIPLTYRIDGGYTWKLKEISIDSIKKLKNGTKKTVKGKGVTVKYTKKKKYAKFKISRERRAVKFYLKKKKIKVSK
ncbi:MAG: DUF6531 domain-containing protein [Eubacterium sp.]|nr:DUF6531 domain-containing protein [Eubacterium sp.]